MFLPKKLIFKFMELGLGPRTCFSLETKNPLLLNFRLTPSEAEAVQRALPRGFTLQKIRFCESDEKPDYWISYNFYEVKYPKKELSAIRKSRCEINTFVEDTDGRKGVYVFCGSPYVSRESRPSPIGAICDFAERLVMFIYGCGKLIRLGYELSERRLTIELAEGKNVLKLSQDVASTSGPAEKLSTDYLLYNDISFFNLGKTYDLVNVNSAFIAATSHCIEGDRLSHCTFEGPFFRRAPDRLYFHRGEIAYLVNSMNRL